MLEELEIDFMGVSIDSLMVVCDAETAELVKSAVKEAGVRIEEVGWVEKGRKGAFVVEGGEIREIKPRFRESAYTPLKKVVGEETPPDFEEMRRKVDEAAMKAVEKKKRVLERLGRV